ncbi:Kv channel-interacting protein 4-like [Zerene cesonia]|uniref:Kv channel-interacting protein 4-like n=1 Tax=Zerene cesonia TaxID=33412 RepID=UPI0018E52E9F|nr:Kv channel-interacting protein 4-like [Zerene cesonia]
MTVAFARKYSTFSNCIKKRLNWVRNATASSLEGRAGAGEAESPAPAPDAEAPTRRRRHRPLYRRLFQYVRTAWTGVKFALGLTTQSENSEFEELGEQLPRYRPDSIAALRRQTRFTEPELKRLYRGFKAECPTGVVREDTFKLIYSQFFPQGANTAQYAHYVFNTLDQDRSGLLSFEEFVTGLSVLSRGTIEEKLRWTFSLYDINGDGYITKEEMTEIVTAIYDLMGKIVEPMIDDDAIREKVERLFQKMDLNRDGVLTLDEFLDCCLRDEDIIRSMGVFDSNF